MYGSVLGAGATVAATGAVLMLPNTGGNVVLNIAVSLGAGLVVWGVAYAKSRIS